MGASTSPRCARLDQAHHLHPFTDHRAMHRTGTHVVRSAKGSTVVDEDGRELLDGLAGLWCVNVGYGREEIADAVAEQMRAVAFYPSFFNTTTEPTIRLAGAPRGARARRGSSTRSSATRAPRRTRPR